jgi:hypothetical protein
MNQSTDDGRHDGAGAGSWLSMGVALITVAMVVAATLWL